MAVQQQKEFLLLQVRIVARVSLFINQPDHYLHESSPDSQYHLSSALLSFPLEFLEGKEGMLEGQVKGQEVHSRSTTKRRRVRR